MRFQIGIYYIRNKGNTVLVRETTVSVTQDTSPFDNLVLAGQSDRIYLKLSDPEVGVILGDVDKAAYVEGFYLSGRAMEIHKVDNIYYDGTCSNCNNPLATYENITKLGFIKCPYCGAVFTEYISNPLNNATFRAALIDRSMVPVNAPITYPFKLPFGYPPPKAVNNLLRIGGIKEDALLTEENTLALDYEINYLD